MGKRLQILAVTVPLMAAGPVEEGHRSTAGLGYLATVQIKQDYTGREGVLLLEHTTQSPKGWTVSFEGSTAVGDRSYSPELLAWHPEFAGAVAVRGGFHGDHAGIEMGAGGLVDPLFSTRAVSTSVWGGAREFYVWAVTRPGNLIGDVDTTRRAIGLGHDSDKIRGQFGAWGSLQESSPVISLRTDVAATDAIWVGARARVYGNTEWDAGYERRLVLTVSTALAGASL